MEPGDGGEKQLQFWGEAPFDTTISAGNSVTLSIPWPKCNQGSYEKSMICSQPYHKASILLTFKTTTDRQQIFAFPENTNDPKNPRGRHFKIKCMASSHSHIQSLVL